MNCRLFHMLQVFSFVGVLSCSSTPSPDSPPPPPLLFQRGDQLVFANFNVPPRGSWVIVRHPTNDTTIGVVRVVDPQAGTADWYCTPSSKLLELLEDGVPVSQLKPDTVWRLNDCGASFIDDRGICRTLEDAQCEAGYRYLRIGIGTSDGVRDGDVYKVFGQITVDAGTGAVAMHEIAKCSVISGPSDQSSYCRVDIRVWKGFDSYNHGFGFIQLETKNRPNQAE